MKIKKIVAYEILDSRGNPTIAVDLLLEDGSLGSFQVPSGASTGSYEALELRDNDKEFLGKGVKKAIRNIDKIKFNLYDKDFNQESLDNFLIELDGTANKSSLGANSILAISIAFAKASARFYNLPLYDYLNKLAFKKDFGSERMVPGRSVLFSNIINGGLHAGNSLNVQEFLIIANLDNTYENIRATSEVYHYLKKIIENEYGKEQTNVGDEGGFAPSIRSVREALNLIVEAINSAGYEGKVAIGLDAAATDFYDKEKKLYEVEKGKFLNYKELTNFYNNLIKKYPIISIEDPFSEDDFKGWIYFFKNCSQPIIENFLRKDNFLNIVGDDLLVTNPERIKEVQRKNLCNSLLLKINQIGTLTESLESFRLAFNKEWVTIVSHRSGETTDDFISDLAIALNSPIKIGAPARGERIVKYNRLLKLYHSFSK